MNMFVKALIATPLALLAFAGDSQAQFGWGGGRSGFSLGGRNGVNFSNSAYGNPYWGGNNASSFNIGGRNGIGYSTNSFGNPYWGGQGSNFSVGGLNFGSSSYGSPYGLGVNSYSTPWGGLSVPTFGSGGYGYNSGYSSGYYPSSGYSSGYYSPSYSSGTVIGGYSSGTPVYSSAGTIITSSPSALIQMPNAGVVQASGTASGSGKYTVVVPDKAQVWFNGTKSNQTGTRHDFSFTQGGQVTIKVKWMNGSQEMTKEMMVNVNPGEESTIDLTPLLN